MDASTRAATNRSIRTIKTELEFLLDNNLLSDSQFAAITELIPRANSNPLATPVQSAVSPPPALAAPTAQLANTHLNDKRESSSYYQPTPPPPAYNQPPMPPAGPTVLASAVSLYAYQPSDAGDLALSPQDRVQIHEYMNADWAKGRNERTGMEGIFPRSYVRVEQEKAMGMGMQGGIGMAQGPPPVREGMGYGNVPMQVATEPMGQQPSGQPSKMEANGKKFGKKLGNAAIFGAGATIGGNIVNSIF